MAVKHSTRGGDRAAPPVERAAQRRRTRKAIVDATIRLLAQGETPSVVDVANAADVSRRTVYMYFPTFDQLLIDATLGALSQTSIDDQIDAVPESDDVDRRVERMVKALHRVSPDVERLGRALIRLTVESGGAPPDRSMPRRGYRRVEWIESALAPLRKSVDTRRFRRLVDALAMIVGWEALIAQRDVCGLDAAEGEQLSLWAARALVRATLEDAAAKTHAGRHAAPKGRAR